MHATVIPANVGGSQHSRNTQSYQLAACARATGARAPARQGFAVARAPPQTAVDPRHAAQPTCRPVADGCKRLQPGNMSEAAVVSCFSSPCFFSLRRCSTLGLAKTTQSYSARTYVATQACTSQEAMTARTYWGLAHNTHLPHAAWLQTGFGAPCDYRDVTHCAIITEWTTRLGA